MELENETLSGIYKSIGRCIAIVDDKVQNIFGKQLADYFEYHQIKYKPLVYKGNEVDKEIASVENILVDLKKNGVSRNEPVLIIGGKSPTAVLIVCYIFLINVIKYLWSSHNNYICFQAVWSQISEDLLVLFITEVLHMLCFVPQLCQVAT